MSRLRCFINKLTGQYIHLRFLLLSSQYQRRTKMNFLPLQDLTVNIITTTTAAKRNVSLRADADHSLLYLRISNRKSISNQVMRQLLHSVISCASVCPCQSQRYEWNRLQGGGHHLQGHHSRYPLHLVPLHRTDGQTRGQLAEETGQGTLFFALHTVIKINVTHSVLNVK